MAIPSLSFEELEALHDVLEAARCYWNKHPLARQRAAKALQTTNRLYWRLGEELPKTGTPSERFRPVNHSTPGTLVEQIVNFVLDLSRDYANKNDPWWADNRQTDDRIVPQRALNDHTSSLVYRRSRRLKLILLAS